MPSEMNDVPEQAEATPEPEQEPTRCEWCEQESDPESLLSVPHPSRPRVRINVCGDCNFTCADCGTDTHREDRYSRCGNDVCPDCDSNYYDCARCGGDVHADNAFYPHDNASAHCEHCSDLVREESAELDEDDEEEEPPRVIKGYHSSHHTPQQNAWSGRRGGRYFGVELEVEVHGTGFPNPEPHAAKVRDAMDSIRPSLGISEGTPVLFFENDGSLRNGFEIISQPLGLPQHRTLWRKLLKSVNVEGLRSHNTTTCGLHVHMSRAGLTTTQIGKMVVFLNHPDNERLIRAIARRYSSDFCEIKYKTLQDTQSTDRYEALNLCNSKTLEFRIFKGSLKPDAVIAAVEFCHAVAEFCREDAPWGMSFSTEGFLESLIDPKMVDETKTLRKYLKERGIIVPEPREPLQAWSSPGEDILRAATEIDQLASGGTGPLFLTGDGRIVSTPDSL